MTAVKPSAVEVGQRVALAAVKKAAGLVVATHLILHHTVQFVFVKLSLKARY